MTTMEISKICYDLGIKYVDNNVFGTKLWYKKTLIGELKPRGRSQWYVCFERSKKIIENCKNLVKEFQAEIKQIKESEINENLLKLQEDF